MSDVLLPFESATHGELLRDESRRSGEAARVAMPRSESDVVEVLRQCDADAEPVTIQGARTGITAGAVPDSGSILNLSRMDRIVGTGPAGDTALLRVQPGLTLKDLREATERDSLFFAPDPTEVSASIGGMTACNASGARSFRYGAIRNHIEALRVVLAGGDTLCLRRGECISRGRAFELSSEQGTIFKGQLPGYRMPSVKNAAGYFAADDMDLVDLFIGMEGTLGVVTEVELRLMAHPKAIWGLVAFLPSQDAALSFVRALRQETVEGVAEQIERPVAIELFNSDALELLRAMRETNAAFGSLPHIDGAHHTAVYVEYHGDDEDSVAEAINGAARAVELLGGSEDATWVAADVREMERLKAFRHAIPEAVNLTIDARRRSEPRLTKLGTDMSVPDTFLAQTMAMYDDGLARAGLESVIFGHVGDNHLHVNILPRTLEEYARGKQLYGEWARKVIGWGGSVSAEHGIGKLKCDFLTMMYGQDGIEQMRQLKRVFDPRGILNRGNLFEWQEKS